MMRNSLTISAALLACLGLLLAGCYQGGSAAAKKGDEPGAHEHDHDHAHHGPHGGHIMEIGDEEYHAEWTHDDSGRVTFYILSADAKEEVPIAAEEVTIDVKVGDNQPVEYKLQAHNPVDGKSAAFETVDKQLLGVLETIKSPGIVATLHVNINGKQFDTAIKEHEHGH
jgi:hypothetical protein